MKYCLHCGRIYAESYIRYENESCGQCGFKTIEDTTMTEEQFLQLSDTEKDSYEIKIYNICIQSEFFDDREYKEVHCNLKDWYYTFRFDKYEQLSGKKAYTKENEAYHDMESQKRVNEAMTKYAGTIGKSNRNKVKCPFCQSTNVREIGTRERAISVLGLGLLSRKINKSFKCRNCGGTF